MVMNEHPPTAAMPTLAPIDPRPVTATSAPPAAPPTHALGADEARFLIGWLHERDAECPGCRYNLRNLTQPTCPECREPLRLVVSLEQPRFLTFVAAVAPGIFAGIFAAVLLIVMVIHPGAPWQIVTTTVIGAISGLGALALLAGRQRYLKMSRAAQISWAMIIWLVHAFVYALLIVSTA